MQKIAIVRASNLNVSLGDDKRSALRQYQRNLTSNGNIVAPTHQQMLREIIGVVVRKGWELQDNITIFYLSIDSAPDKLFAVTVNTNPEIAITRENDRVKMSFIDTDEEIVSTSTFDLLGFNLQKSEIQKAYELQYHESESKLRQVEKVKEAKKSLENLSPEELQELYRIKKEKEQGDKD